MDKSNYKICDEGYGKSKKIILFGTGDLAQIANLYFTRDTEYEVCGFTVHRDFIKEETLMGLPVVPFEEVETYFPPEAHDIHVCVVYDNLNRTRVKIGNEAERKRYELASYVSPYSFVASTAKLGKHVFIFENNVIQDFVEIGNFVIFWSGNHVGHSTKIHGNVFVSSHVCISGWCDIGENSFLGVNSTIANGISIGRESWIMHGSIISSDVPPNSFVKTVQSEIMPLNEEALNRALERKKK